MAGKDFKRAVSGEAVRVDGRASPAALHARGITTPEVLAWLEAKAPETPSPAHVPDDPHGWTEAVQDAEGERQRRAAAIKARFHAKADKLRDDLRLARDYKERER